MNSPRGISKILSAVMAAGFCVLCGCVGSQGSAVVTVDPSGWEPGDIRTVVYRNSDTSYLQSISVFVLHESGLPSKYDSLRLRISTTSPDSLTFSEEYTFRPMPDDSGKGRIWVETRQPYRSKVLLREGDYTFGISHEMEGNVYGIRAVGIEIGSGN